MSNLTKKLKYVLPVLPIGLVAITAAIAAGQAAPRPADTQPSQIQAGVSAQAGVTGSVSQDPVSVTVDGQPVGVGSNGVANLNSDDSHASVTVTHSSASNQSSGQTTTTTSPDGTVNISVTSNTSGNNGSSHTFYSSFGSSNTSSHQNMDVFTNGTGNISVTK